MCFAGAIGLIPACAVVLCTLRIDLRRAWRRITVHAGMGRLFFLCHTLPHSTIRIALSLPLSLPLFLLTLLFIFYRYRVLFRSAGSEAMSQFCLVASSFTFPSVMLVLSDSSYSAS